MNRWDGKKVKSWKEYVGSRCLVAEDKYNARGIEVKVVEVSPGGRVKFKYPSDHERWEDRDAYLLIEKLEE